MKKGKFHTDSKRACIFNVDFETQATGPEGLAMAILLQAVRDGCCANWLKEIVTAYHMNVSPEIFDRIPARRVKMDVWNNSYATIDQECNRHKLSLEWPDGASYIKATRYL